MKLIFAFFTSFVIVVGGSGLADQLKLVPIETSEIHEVSIVQEPEVNTAAYNRINETTNLQGEPDPQNYEESRINPPLEEVHYYENSEGEQVQSPTRYESAPQGATAICYDGTYSFSRNRRGTCSHHGGVKEWLR